ncbi:MAG: hypothetical protein R2692_04045 [Microbacterium sp.]
MRRWSPRRRADARRGSADRGWDARVPALLAAAGLLLMRAPFLVVVTSAALVAALLRLWGLAA